MAADDKDFLLQWWAAAELSAAELDLLKRLPLFEIESNDATGVSPRDISDRTAADQVLQSGDGQC